MARQPSGRPHDIQRQAALILGEVTYTGSPCKRCGATRRYTKGSGCVDCQKSNAIEARLLLRAARKNHELDFLDSDPQLTNSRTPSLFLAELVSTNECGEEGGEGKKAGSYCMVIPSPIENAHLREYVSSTSTDPEPICPQCGCGVEAEFAERDGWLQRIGHWHCTICEWTDPEPPPAESLDTDDWLG